jgi:hypothetical protein
MGRAILGPPERVGRPPSLVEKRNTQMAKDTHDYCSAYTPLGLAQIISTMRYGDLQEVALELQTRAEENPPKTAEDFAELLFRWAEYTIEEASAEEED